MQMHRLFEKAHSEYLSKAVFHCPLTLHNHIGTSRQSCYYGDSGCGYQCIIQALRALSDAQWNKIRNRPGVQSTDISLPIQKSLPIETLMQHHVQGKNWPSMTTSRKTNSPA